MIFINKFNLLQNKQQSPLSKICLFNILIKRDTAALAKHGQYRTNCSEYADVNSFGVHKSDLKFHNTMKLYKMFKDIILDASPRGGIVLDGFMGSNPIIIATEKAKRICLTLMSFMQEMAKHITNCCMGNCAILYFITIYKNTVR